MSNPHPDTTRYASSLAPEREKEIRERLEYASDNKSWGIEYEIGTDLLAAYDALIAENARLRLALNEISRMEGNPDCDRDYDAARFAVETARAALKL